MLESTIETALVERIKALGGETRKVKWLDRNGAPDRLVLLPKITQQYSIDGPKGRTYHGRILREAQTIWVELKAPGKKPRPNQVREHERLTALGQTVYTIDSIVGVQRFFPIKD